MAENQTEFFRLEQRSVNRVLVAEKSKPSELYRRICDVYEILPESKRQSMEWKHTNSPVKKKFRAQWSMKNSFWGHERPHHCGFP